MPNIREYNATNGFQPNSASASTAAEGGRSINALTQNAASLQREAGRAKAQAISTLGEGVAQFGQSAITEVDRYLTQKEVMRMGKDQALLTNAAVKGWNDTRSKADPNDPNVIKDYNEKTLQPMLDSFVESYTTTEGQARAAQVAGRLLQEIQHTQLSDQQTAEGEAAVQNLTTMSNAQADTLANDPSKLDLVNEQTMQAIDAAKRSPGLNAEQAAHLDALGAKFRNDNAFAAFHGMVEKNPTAAKAALEAGFSKEDLSAKDRITMSGWADAAIAREKTEANTAEVRKRQEAERKDDRDASLLIASLHPTNGADGEVVIPPDYYRSVSEMASRDYAKPEQTRVLYAMGEKITDDIANGRTIRTDPSVKEDFSKRVLLPVDDPRSLTITQVAKARLDGKLSNYDMALYEGTITRIANDPKYKQALAEITKKVGSLKAYIAPSQGMFGSASPQQLDNYGRFQTAAQRKFETMYQDGTWGQLLDDKSPNFLGRMATEGGYNINTKQGQKDFRENVRGTPSLPEPAGGALKRLPGETPDQYTKRLNGGK